jgi:hypothetical protein
MTSASGGEASGTQIKPLLPSAIVPSAARKSRTALRLCRAIEWDHAASERRMSFRLSGSSAFRRIARMYSIDSRVGFAPGRANSNLGARRSSDMGYTYTWSHICVPPLLLLRPADRRCGPLSPASRFDSSWTVRHSRPRKANPRVAGVSRVGRDSPGNLLETQLESSRGASLEGSLKRVDEAGNAGPSTGRRKGAGHSGDARVCGGSDGNSADTDNGQGFHSEADGGSRRRGGRCRHGWRSCADARGRLRCSGSSQGGRRRRWTAGSGSCLSHRSRCGSC